MRNNNNTLNNNNNNNNKDMPAKAKCPKIDTSNKKSDNNSGVKPPVMKNKVQNKFFQHVKKSQDDAVVPPLNLKKKEEPRN